MYNSNNVAERIKSVAKARNLSLKQLMNDVGLGFNTMANMKTSMPKSDNIAKIADRLECSVDFLLGRTEDPMLHKIEEVKNHQTQNEQSFILLEIFNELDPIKQAKLLLYADELKK